ncbi:MAG: hypothetical protein V4492_06330 [Chlamydiota bacterium]
MASSSTPASSSSTFYPSYRTGLTVSTPEAAEHVVDSIGSNDTLTSLTIDSNALPLGLRGLTTAIDHNETLTKLSLLECHCLNNGYETELLARTLTNNQNITSLQLSLRTLFHSFLRLGPMAVEPLSLMLSRNSSLTHLDLRACNIGDHETGQLALALTTNSTLRSLKLGANSISDSGIEQLLEAITVNTTLTDLGLNYNKFSDIGMQRIATALRTNSILMNLNLSESHLRVGTGMEALTQALTTNSTLTMIDLSSCSLRNRGLEELGLALRVNSTLSVLNLRENNSNRFAPNFDYIGAGHLFDSFAHNRTLTCVDLRNNNIGSTAATRLAQALATNSSITDLDLFENNISNSGLSSLALALTSNSTLTRLDVGHNHIIGSDPRFAQVLGGVLNYANRGLDNPDAERPGIQCLTEALKVNTVLTRLSLKENTLLGSMADLATILTHNTSLTSLDLSTCSMVDVSYGGPDDGAVLAYACEKNPTLRDLRMVGPGLGGLTPHSFERIHHSTARNKRNNDLRSLTLLDLLLRSSQKEAFNHLPQAVKNKVYESIWTLSGRPQGDLLFGEHHVFDSFSLFCAALEHAGITLH